VLLTGIGAWGQAVFTIWQERKAQKELIRNFCIDTVNNIRAIVDDMVDHQKLKKGIHPDHLALLDIEWNVFGRNRVHLIHLPNPVGENVRKFVTDCEIRKAEIGNYLSQYLQELERADRLQSSGQAPQAQRVRQDAQGGPLNSAIQALDQLATRVSGSADLVKSLEAVR
jgi:hypothetical protein